MASLKGLEPALRVIFAELLPVWAEFAMVEAAVRDVTGAGALAV